MINEKKLTKYYNQIAEKLEQIIPIEWDKVVMYSEETGNTSSVSFYFYSEDCTEVCHSGNIPDKYNVNEDFFDSSIDELIDINKKLWSEFLISGQSTWCSLTFYLDSNWKFKVKYGYERNSEISRLEREIRWAYDELGIIPDDEYEKELLLEYLNEQGKTL
ncbi:immunity protein YezG family protein [Oceanirhabdus sp. W0125-5]|uniref:immunity protein YezG family protein n=1 Tax=Oceanirhabdus sp. W0125-5 TaxID=2999116 RepID=UPI0022F2DEF2|nr:immunity protein YezG family protein [Oceanirhabdus sp. W0125-5]WBW97142.1 DUF600 family protein [Oceanirhabdus sp. W0125-5]